MAASVDCMGVQREGAGGGGGETAANGRSQEVGGRVLRWSREGRLLRFCS